MKNKAIVFIALVIIGAVVFASGCISPDTKAPNGDWTLSGLGPDNTATNGIISIEITDSKISGNSGVNLYFGSISFDSQGKLTISDIGSTKMSGPDHLMTQEQEYYNALNNVTGYKIVDGTLKFTDKSENVILTFKETSPIFGQWLLASDTNVTINFNADGSLGGQAPVNVYGGSYTISGNTLSVGDDLISTMMAGTEEEMQAEFAYYNALTKSSTFSIIDSNLVITDEDGKELLVFIQA
ncbi:MAG TPA: META domain-containing protein [Methanocorpusculum sp.]|nr:META domain-containing protein [Methanocorpusculum sp.]HJJ53709.1 META domain-containing protein [Methanocorpusculum sp.]